MSFEPNVETQNALKTELKALQSRCIDTYNNIENLPIDTQYITSDNVDEKILSYIEGLRTDIENSNTPIVTDDNLLSIQFLTDINQRTTEVEELIAYSRGSIHDVDSEINRLEILINTSREAKSRPKVQRQDVRPDHLQKAKERFQMMKNELHGLIQSLFPNNFEKIAEILGQLMMEKRNESSSGYIAKTSENYKLIELLNDINLVTENPYNKMEVKLAF